MTASLIILSIFTLFFIIAFLYTYLQLSKLNNRVDNLHRLNHSLQEENNDLSTLNREYERFLNGVTQVLEEDVDFLKGTLVQKLSLDIPEVTDLYRGLTRFKDDISKIKSVMSEVEHTRKEDE